MSQDAGVESDGGVVADAGAPDAGVGLTTAALAGTFLANNPTTACYATILDHSVVAVTATDADTVSINDGTLTFNCDLSGTTLVCPAVNGSSNVTLTPGVNCVWPYTVTVGITNVTADSFDGAIAFATSPSPSGEQCANVLGTCNGTAAGAFQRFVPTQQEPSAPPPRAMVKKAN